MRYHVWEKLAHKYNRLWVQKYSLGPTRREVKSVLLPYLKENPDCRVLEIGCGTGQLIREIGESVKDVDYLGIDVAETMVDIAKKSNDGRRMQFLVCSVEEFAGEGKYDIIFCTHAFPYFPDKPAVIEKMAALCKEGGQIIIANSSTNSLKDLVINFFLKATTSEAKYLSIKKMKKLFAGAGLTVKEVRIIREKWYMPTIAMFHTER